MLKSIRFPDIDAMGNYSDEKGSSRHEVFNLKAEIHHIRKKIAKKLAFDSKISEAREH